MDELAMGTSPAHALHPLTKLAATLAYIGVTASFAPYDLPGLFPMILYPAFLFPFGGISLKTGLYKVRFVLLPVCAVGLFNPLLDTAPLLQIGAVIVSGGVVSMLTLMLKGVLCLLASVWLAATTSIDRLCAALRAVHVPGLIVTLMLLTYRYVSVMLEEVSVMTTAYRLRAPRQRGVRPAAWGSFLGQLLLRSLDRAEQLYDSMRLRGFDGQFWHAVSPRPAWRDAAFAAAAAVFLIGCRAFPVARWIGAWLTGGMT